MLDIYSIVNNVSIILPCICRALTLYWFTGTFIVCCTIGVFPQKPILHLYTDLPL
jgi:hypothetical protein